MRHEKHGMFNTSEYNAWRNMRQRCSNPNRPGFELYGARGIKVCERWQRSFSNFYEDMGPKPAGTSLERIDNGQGYSPQNCKWATIHEQNTNRRNNVRVTISGVTKTFWEWTSILPIKPQTASRRYYIYGWDAVDSLTRLIRHQGLLRETETMSDATDDLEMQPYRVGGVIDRTDYFWTTRDGKRLNIRDMQTSHIRNCIRMLERQLSQRPAYMPYMGDSDYADDWVESEERHNEQLAEDIQESMQHFERELRRRGEVTDLQPTKPESHPGVTSKASRGGAE